VSEINVKNKTSSHTERSHKDTLAATETKIQYLVFTGRKVAVTSIGVHIYIYISVKTDLLEGHNIQGEGRMMIKVY
jgi:hypothetical protein